jgi:site-specific recombinase XerD
VLAKLVGRTRDYVRKAKAKATRRAYKRDWRSFEGWCQGHQLAALPAAPETLALYIAGLAEAGRKVSSIERALASISQAHKAAGHESPRSSAAVRNTLQGIKRVHTTAQDQKDPVLVEELRAMVKALPTSLRGLRDRALLLVGFAGGFRRSELVALDREHVRLVSDGLEVVIKRSKTDPEGEGRKVGIPFGSDPATCPVRTLNAWLTSSGITEGAMFRGITRHHKLTEYRLDGKDVARAVKRAGKAAGMDTSKLAGHSLRAGLATAAARAGKSERSIMAQTGHRSVIMVRRYIRDANLFTDNAAAGIGL